MIDPAVLDEAMRRYQQTADPVQQVAADLGISYHTIMNERKKRGLPPRRGIKPRNDLPLSRIIAAYQGGQSVASLAREHGVEKRAISRRLQEAGVQRRGPGGSWFVDPAILDEALHRYQAILDELGIHHQALRRAWEQHGPIEVRQDRTGPRRIDTPTVPEVVQAWRATGSIRAAAAQLGVSVTRAQARLAAVGLAQHPDGRRRLPRGSASGDVEGQSCR